MVCIQKEKLLLIIFNVLSITNDIPGLIECVWSLLCFSERCLDLSLSPPSIASSKGFLYSSRFALACIEHSNIGFKMSLQKPMTEAKGMAVFCYSLWSTFNIKIYTEKTSVTRAGSSKNIYIQEKYIGKIWEFMLKIDCF